MPFFTFLSTWGAKFPLSPLDPPLVRVLVAEDKIFERANENLKVAKYDEIGLISPPLDEENFQ